MAFKRTDRPFPDRHPGRRRAMFLGIVTIQSIAAGYLILDGLFDLIVQPNIEIVMECLVAFALAIGILLGLRDMRQLNRELDRQERALAGARGALAELITLRFEEWGLSRSEGEVALFALKGCDIAQIARLRGAATGTVRSQLSQVYAKAGVTSQAMLVSLFIDDLLDAPALPHP